MRKTGLVLALVACISLAGCTPPGQLDVRSTPTPATVDGAVSSALSTIDQATTACDATTWDEIGLKALWGSFDKLLDYVDSKHLVYGSPEAMRERKLLVRIRAGIRAVTNARNACSGGSWINSLGSLRSAFAEARSVLR